MLDATEIETCTDAQELNNTLYAARALHNKASIIGSPANVGPSDQWLFPAEKWKGVEAKVRRRLACFLPQTAKALLPVPTALLLSRIFRIGRHERQTGLRFSFKYGAANVTFTGPELRQFDARVLFALYDLARRSLLGEPVDFRPHGLLRAMNVPTTGYYYDELEAAIERLQMSLIRVEYAPDDPRTSFEVQLLGKREWKTGDPRGLWRVHIDQEVRALFDAGYTQFPLALRMSLPDGLVSWLATAIFAIKGRTMARTFRLPLEWLQEACGSNTERRDYRKKVRRACEHLQQAGVLASYGLVRDPNHREFMRVTVA